MTGFIPLFPGIPGGPELLVILLIAVLLFGANKIPELARSSGQAIGEFQKGREEVEEELKQMKDSDIEAESDFDDDVETVDSEAVDADADAETLTESDSTGSSTSKE
ncbi:MAG: twin-arginine translocase TatA/TatE family subunit [Haloarculaceae archaeon]